MNLERLLEPGCADMPECRCGKEMRFAHIVVVFIRYVIALYIVPNVY